MRLLVIDTETTDIESGIPCEISATLYQLGDSIKSTGAIASWSSLLPVTSNKAEAINGIPWQLTQIAHTDSIAWDSISLISRIAQTCDYAIAFNADFDAPIVNKLLNLERLKWICAMKDINWGYPAKPHGNFKLVDLGLWMGIGVSTAHRAGDDVRLLVECLNRRKESLPEMLETATVVAKSPVLELKALVSYENRGLASDAGFFWDGDRKVWVKKVKECHLDSFVKTLSFKTEILS
ncbi:3'-5' exonuclease [Cylindrospermum sp. FACHB-282]|nr:3'-5' exonuclease [Cylindrospermum sp. FACHB-282]